MNDVKKRYDFALIFDVKDGNPNGDPDAGNAPRIDPETGHGLVSDVCLKRKIRNYVTLAKTGADGNPLDGYDIYVKEKAILNQQHERAYRAKGLQPTKTPDQKTQDEVQQWMCQTFFDIRMFGAVMTMGINAGQVRGPVQFVFARSIDPIVSLEQAITRMAVTTEEESKKQDGGNRTMGRKEIVPYGLYVTHGFYSPFLAAKTGFSNDDLGLLWAAQKGMFDIDRSAARGEMAKRKLVIFEHESPLGSAPAQELFERIAITRKDPSVPARSFHDYEVRVNKDNLPSGITVYEV
jgi:CRISPR-associated protein Csd2